jgi:hypothetical protein
LLDTVARIAYKGADALMGDNAPRRQQMAAKKSKGLKKGRKLGGMQTLRAAKK